MIFGLFELGVILVSCIYFYFDKFELQIIIVPYVSPEITPPSLR